uniref:Putative secreted protein n=1 Tax=Anopheles triannulatus TaxID=58253 RepID=A0A2M4B2P1_9DIPT
MALLMLLSKSPSISILLLVFFFGRTWAPFQCLTAHGHGHEHERLVSYLTPVDLGRRIARSQREQHSHDHMLLTLSLN